MRSMPLLAVAAIGCGSSPPKTEAPVRLPDVAPNALRGVDDFRAIGDRAARSRALFAEAARVLVHPRCMNCHPAGNTPHQGMEKQPHDPPVVRGPENAGVVGMECTTCHQDRNQDLARVPGAPKWHLAPIEMAWEDKNVPQICAQLKDPKRNGGRSLAQIVDHGAHDELVGWAWHPGHDREAAPGTQEQFGALMAAWVDTGAECPAEDLHDYQTRIHTRFLEYAR